MTHQQADGDRPLPEDIADLVCCWVIDFLNVNGLEYWEEGPCVASMYKRMAPFLAHQAKSDAALAAAAEQLRAVMEANEILRKQLSDQSHELGVLEGRAEMWQQRAEAAEAQLKKEADRE